MSGSPTTLFSWRNVIATSIALAIPIFGIAAWLCMPWLNAESADNQILNAYLKRTVAPTKLATGFTDANGDMIADAPADMAKQLDPDELVFAPIAGSTRDTEDVWQEFLAHLSKVTGKKVSFTSYEVHHPQIDALNDGNLHVTAFNTGFVPAAVNIAGFVPQVAMAKADGSFMYQMEIIVPKASSIQNASGLKTNKLTVTSTGSHSGFKSPLVVLRDEFNLLPRRDYEFVISGGHSQSIKAIGTKQAGAAAVASDLLEEEIENPESGLKADQYRAVYKSKDFPRAAFGANSRLKPELAAKVRDAYLTFDFKGTELGKKTQGSKVAKFAPVDYKKDWANVRAVEERLVSWN